MRAGSYRYHYTSNETARSGFIQSPAFIPTLHPSEVSVLLFLSHPLHSFPTSHPHPSQWEAWSCLSSSFQSRTLPSCGVCTQWNSRVISIGTQAGSSQIFVSFRYEWGILHGMACFSLVTHVVFISLEEKTLGVVLQKSHPHPHPHLGRFPNAQVCRSSIAGAKNFRHLPPSPQQTWESILGTGFSSIKNTQIFLFCLSELCLLLFACGSDAQ